MKLTEKSYAELLELYVELLEQIVKHHEAKAPQSVIDSIKDSQREVRNELRKRRPGK